MHKNKYIIVFITAPNMAESKKIANTLLNKKLTACANIVPKMHSYYWWKGKIEFSEELLLILKTEERCLKNIISAVKKIHSYEVPEIISLPITDGSRAYLGWIKNSID